MIDIVIAGLAIFFGAAAMVLAVLVLFRLDSEGWK